MGCICSGLAPAARAAISPADSAQFQIAGWAIRPDAEDEGVVDNEPTMTAVAAVGVLLVVSVVPAAPLKNAVRLAVLAHTPAA